MTNSRDLMIQLAQIRRNRGITESDIAERMNGMNVNYVRKLETGQNDPKLSTVIRYAEAIRVRITITGVVPLDREATK